MEKKEDLVTIITLNYNNQFLKDAIDSVLSQTYGSIQFVLLDDGCLLYTSRQMQTAAGIISEDTRIGFQQRNHSRVFR